MDDTSLRAPVLDNHPYDGFQPLKTIWAVFFLICLMITVELIILSFVFVWTDVYVRCDLFFLIIYLQISFWTINFMMRFYINWKHKVLLLANRYFQFYEVSTRYIEIPFYISCICLCFLTVLICLYLEFYKPSPLSDHFCDDESFYQGVYSPIYVVTITISLENILLIPLYAVYIMKVYEFNKRQTFPDSENGNYDMPSVLRESLYSGDIGYRERYEKMDNMLEKQADLIRYYKEANEFLNKKVFDLTSQGRSGLESS